ncbi:MAG: peptidoglycan-binding domain-containing protein [Candidatus Pacebacteria bacterium]|nr:peptidoglycan-binding domain-containing protein [Candidatus Paceibacterota bacterium]
MKKLLTAGVVALGLIVSAQSVSAQSIAELQAMIAALQAQLAALAGQGTTTTSAYTHTVTLKVGSKGAQVTALQSALNSLGFNAGAADGIFGNGTKAAVVAFQASKGLVADGIVGPATGAALSAATVTNPGNGDSGSNGTLNGGEADIRKVSDRIEDDMMNNKANQEVLSFSVELDKNSGDIAIERIDAYFDTNVLGEARAYRIFDDIAIERDGKTLASVDSSKRTNWRTGAGAPGPLGDYVRLSGFSSVVKSGQTADFMMVVDTANIDAADITAGTDANVVFVVRYVDAAGIISEFSTTSQNIAVETNTGADVRVKVSPDNPDSYSVKGYNNKVTTGVEAFVFTVESRDMDSYLETAEVEVTGNFAGTGTEDTLVRRAYLYEGSTLVDQGSLSGGVITFDLDELRVKSGKTLEFTVELDLQKIDGTVITSGDDFTVLLNKVTGYDADDEDINEVGIPLLSGNAHTYSTSVANISNANVKAITSDTVPVGYIDFGFKATADDEDIVFTVGDMVANITGNTAWNLDGGSPFDDGEYQVTLTKVSGNATNSGGTWTINAGQSATFELSYAFKGVAGNDARVLLEKIMGETVDILSDRLTLKTA